MDEGEDDHAYSLYAHNNMLVFLDALDKTFIAFKYTICYSYPFFFLKISGGVDTAFSCIIRCEKSQKIDRVLTDDLNFVVFWISVDPEWYGCIAPPFRFESKCIVACCLNE